MTIPALRRGCVIALCSFAFAATGWAAHYNRELFRRSRPALAGLEAEITRAGWRLSIVLDPLLGRAYDNAQAEVPFAAPLLNLGKLYAVEQGGIRSFVFAFDAATNAIGVRPERVGKCPWPQALATPTRYSTRSAQVEDPCGKPSRPIWPPVPPTSRT